MANPWNDSGLATHRRPGSYCLDVSKKTRNKLIELTIVLCSCCVLLLLRSTSLAVCDRPDHPDHPDQNLAPSTVKTVLKVRKLLSKFGRAAGGVLRVRVRDTAEAAAAAHSSTTNNREWQTSGSSSCCRADQISDEQTFGSNDILSFSCRQLQIWHQSSKAGERQQPSRAIETHQGQVSAAVTPGYHF